MNRCGFCKGENRPYLYQSNFSFCIFSVTSREEMRQLRREREFLWGTWGSWDAESRELSARTHTHTHTPTHSSQPGLSAIAGWGRAAASRGTRSQPFALVMYFVATSILANRKEETVFEAVPVALFHPMRDFVEQKRASPYVDWHAI